MALGIEHFAQVSPGLPPTLPPRQYVRNGYLYTRELTAREVSILA